MNKYFSSIKRKLTVFVGDVEVNPGPPKRGGPPGGKQKEPTKEEQMKMLQDKVTRKYF